MKLLCVDDHESELVLRRAVLERNGYEVVTAPEGFAAVERAVAGDLAAVVLDYRMDGMDGEAIAKVLKARLPQLPIVMLSGYDVPDRVKNLVDAFVAKAQPVEILLDAISKVIHGAAGHAAGSSESGV